jgi:polysaccharide biosynthesis protein PslH
MKRILVVCPYTLSPPLGGGKMAVLYRCNELAKHHRLFLFCPEEAGAGTSVPGPFERAFHSGYRIVGGHPILNHLLRSWLSPHPFSSSFLGRDAGAQIARIVAEEKIDLVLVEHFYSALHLLPFLRRTGGVCPRIGIIEQNIEHNVWLDQVKFGHVRLAMRLTARLEAAKLRARMRAIYGAVDGVAFISEKDRLEAAALCPHPNLQTCNVILPVPAAQKTDFRGRGRICYWGGLGYFANLEGVMWFTREVWPRVRAQRPQAELRIFDRLEVRSGLRHATPDQGISFTGAISPAEMDRLALECDGFISPIRMGSGIKLKNIVAMALGLPIVATSSSMAGNFAQPGRDFFLADTADRFAEGVIEVLDSEARRTDLGTHAHRAFRGHYTAEAATAGWLQFIDSLQA